MQYSCGRSFDLLCSPTRDVTQLTYRKTELVSCLENKGGAVIRALANYHCDPGSNPRVDTICGWSCCWLSCLLREVFLRALRFSPFLKNHHVLIPIRSGTHGHISWVNKFPIFVDCYKLRNNWRPNFIVPQGKEIVQIKRFFSLLQPPPPFPLILGCHSKFLM